MRRRTDWDKVMKNTEYCRKYDNANVDFNGLVSFLSVMRFYEVIDFCLERPKLIDQINWAMLEEPHSLRVNNLPKKIKDSFPFRYKIKAHFLRDFYPDIFKQLIGVILSRKLWEPLPLEMENLQETWGIGLKDKSDDFGALFNLDGQQRDLDSFGKIPSWIPKSDIVNNWGDEREGDL